MRHFPQSMLILLLILALPTASPAQLGPTALEPVFQGQSPPLTELLASLEATVAARGSLGPPVAYEVPDLEPFLPGT
ncbi:MAG: hypothetical protein GY856_49180, partial [bacterium]|nr:hypothetical protein [bacterium]